MLSIYLSMLETDEERRIFTERYEECKYDCLHVANSILHDAALAEDMVHEAFMAVIQRREKYFALSCRDFRRLIVVIVRNKSFNRRRLRQRLASFPEDEDDFVLVDERTNVEEQIIQGITAQEVSGHLNQISEISRQVLYMKYVDGMSYKEIGAELDMTEKTVEVRIARAKQKVRKLMAQGARL